MSKFCHIVKFCVSLSTFVDIVDSRMRQMRHIRSKCVNFASIYLCYCYHRILTNKLETICFDTSMLIIAQNFQLVGQTLSFVLKDSGRTDLQYL